MDLDEIKRGLRAEIKKRENEQYATFQCNVREMCKDVLAKLEEQESEIAELKEKHRTEVKELLCLIRNKENNFNRAFDSEEKEIRHNKYKRCLATAKICECRTAYTCGLRLRHNLIWRERWLKIAEKFKEAK